MDKCHKNYFLPFVFSEEEKTQHRISRVHHSLKITLSQVYIVKFNSWVQKVVWKNARFFGIVVLAAMVLVVVVVVVFSLLNSHYKQISISSSKWQPQPNRHRKFVIVAINEKQNKTNIAKIKRNKMWSNYNLTQIKFSFVLFEIKCSEM